MKSSEKSPPEANPVWVESNAAIPRAIPVPIASRRIDPLLLCGKQCCVDGPGPGVRRSGGLDPAGGEQFSNRGDPSGRHEAGKKSAARYAHKSSRHALLLFPGEESRFRPYNPQQIHSRRGPMNKCVRRNVWLNAVALGVS